MLCINFVKLFVIEYKKLSFKALVYIVKYCYIKTLCQDCIHYCHLFAKDIAYCLQVDNTVDADVSVAHLHYLK